MTTHTDTDVRPLADVLTEHVTQLKTARDAVPVHQRPDSCHVCGSPTTDAGRPACAHDWTNADALAAACEHDRRTTVRYSTGATSAEELYVDGTRGR